MYASNLRRSSRLPGPRNAFALQASLTRSAFFKDRRAPRGGTVNLARQCLDEWLDERADEVAVTGEPAPVSER